MVISQRDLYLLIVELIQKYRAEQAILFGSYGRNEADEQSDIDLLVIGGETFHPTDIFAMAEELHQRTGKAVDVYEEQEIDRKSEFYRTIMREGVPIAA